MSSTGAPQTDGVLKNTARFFQVDIKTDSFIKIRYYRQRYTDRSDPIVFLPVVVNTSSFVYDDFTRLFFLNSHRETGILVAELPEESDQFRFKV